MEPQWTKKENKNQEEKLIDTFLRKEDLEEMRVSSIKCLFLWKQQDNIKADIFYLENVLNSKNKFQHK